MTTLHLCRFGFARWCYVCIYVSVSSPNVYAYFFLFTKTKDHFNFVPVGISRFLEAIRTDAIFTFNERANFTHQYIFEQFLNEKKNTNFTVEISSAKQTNEMPTTIKITILNLSIQYAASGFCRHWLCLYTYIWKLQLHLKWAIKTKCNREKAIEKTIIEK